jgi:hypothetical protein
LTVSGLIGRKLNDQTKPSQISLTPILMKFDFQVSHPMRVLHTEFGRIPTSFFFPLFKKSCPDQLEQKTKNVPFIKLI